MGMMGGMFTLPIFIQTYLGYSVTQTGLLFIPMALGMMIAAPLGGRLASKIEPRFLTSFGMFMGAFTMFLFTGIDIRWTGIDIAIRLFILAAGLGLGMAPLTNAATSTVPTHEIGIASSVLALARNIAGAFGVAIFASIFTNSITSNLLALQRYSVVNSQSPVVLGQVMALMGLKANILSFAAVYHTAMLLMIIGGFAALFVKENKRDFMGKEETSHPIEF
jgi:DHA2 family multidrug resistance protein